MSKVKKSATDINWDAATPEAIGVYQAILMESLKEKTDTTNSLLNQLIVAINKQIESTNRILALAVKPAKTVFNLGTTNALLENLIDTVISQAEETKRAGVLPGNLQGTNILLNKILKTLKDQVDEGKFQDHSGTATTTIAVVDLLKVSPYHAVDNLILTNDGTVNLYFWINEVENTDGSFIKPNESLPISYNNGAAITKLFLKTDTGSADYRLFFLW